MMEFGILTLPDYKFEAHAAAMYPCTDPEHPTQKGWGFFFAAGEPFEQPAADEEEGNPYFLGISFYAADAPIPLPDQEDFTGLEFVLKEPYDLEGGEPYFTFNAGEEQNVSDVHIHFLEKQDARYRVMLSAMVENVVAPHDELCYEGWIQITEAPPTA